MAQRMFVCGYCGREYQLPFLAKHCEIDHEKEDRDGPGRE